MPAAFCGVMRSSWVNKCASSNVNKGVAATRIAVRPLSTCNWPAEIILNGSVWPMAPKMKNVEPGSRVARERQALREGDGEQDEPADQHAAGGDGDWRHGFDRQALEQIGTCPRCCRATTAGDTSTPDARPGARTRRSWLDAPGAVQRRAQRGGDFLAFRRGEETADDQASPVRAQLEHVSCAGGSSSATCTQYG